MKKIFDIDCIGMCASVLCLIHCLFLPWLVALAGVYLGSFFNSPNFHNVMLVVAILIGLPVFVISYLKYKSKLILATGIVGLGLTTFGTVKSDNCCPEINSEAVCMEDGEACEACPEEAENLTETTAQEDEISVVESSSYNLVPIGVSFLIFAHFMNFRKRKSCKNDCCS